MHRQLVTEVAKRKEMERTLADLVKLSGALNRSVNGQQQTQKEGRKRKSALFMDGLGGKRALIKHHLEAASRLKRP